MPIEQAVKISNRILFWNVEGINRLNNMHKDDISYLYKHDIIALCETWETEDRVKLPDYAKLFSKAIKAQGKGRPSLGISVFLRKPKINVIQVLANNEIFISARVTYDKSIVIIIAVYLPPTRAYDEKLHDLQNHIQMIQSEYENEGIVILGDFNARIDNKTETNCKLLTNIHSVGCYRRSQDAGQNSRGEQLLELINNSDLYILNGRTKSDKEGAYTFIGPQGKSVIDICLVNWPAVQITEDMKIHSMNHTWHQPLSLTLCNTNINTDYLIEKKS